jgi:AcrR family transcriptional regulator
MTAATRVFARKGYARASMNEIATAAGVTKPVLYDHFVSKDALFDALLCSIRDNLLAKGRDIGMSSLSEEEKFRSAIGAFFQFVEEQPNAAKVLLIVPQADSVTAKLSSVVQAGATAAISRLLRSYLPAGAAWAHEATGEFLKEGLHALAKWWLGNPGPTRDEIVDVAMKICWEGIPNAAGH